MKKFRILILALVLLGSTAFAQRQYVGWSTGYFPDYDGDPISGINWKAYTHMAFFSINASGNGAGVDSTGNDTPYLNSKGFVAAAHQNGVKALICVGGEGSNGFETATTSGNLAAFVQNLVNYMQRYGYDGIDIDWEPADGSDATVNAQYLALFQSLRAALNKITPTPLLTVAAADFFSGACIPVAQYVDQMNLMTYWASASGTNPYNPDDASETLAGDIKTFTDGGVSKSKIGIGWGYDNDQEYDGPNESGNGANGNPSDVAAKCRLAISGGYGGVMIWEINYAPVACIDSNAYYVNKNASGIRPYFSGQAANGFSLRITNNHGFPMIGYVMAYASFVDLGLYDLKGVLIQNLTHAVRAPGMYSIPLGKNGTGVSIKPGAYVVKLATPTSSQAGEVLLK